jgi:hypothetical protein
MEQKSPPKTRPGNVEIIELHVAELKQLFNSLDPSPFRERDLDKTAADYIVDWAKETSREKDLSLLVHLDRAGLPEEQEILRVATREYFESRSNATRQRLRQLFRLGRTSMLIGLVFLATCIVASDLAGPFLDDTRFGTILRESLFIGGWVAMWRPLEIFLYDWWPLRAEARLYQRLSSMPIEIRYPTPPPIDLPQ